jgi:hypothetical protein
MVYTHHIQRLSSMFLFVLIEETEIILRRETFVYLIPDAVAVRLGRGIAQQECHLNHFNYK